MSNVVKKIQCPKCLDTGCDNYAVYDDESGHCFGCGYHVSTEGSSTLPSNLLHGDFPEILRGRGITKETLKFFNYQVGKYTGKFGNDFVEDEVVHIANIANDKGKVVAQQLRASNKRFTMLGSAKGLGLVGTHLWEPNQLSFVTVVEGYVDQLSVAQAQGTRFAVLTVPCGVGSAVEAFTKSADYLSKFKHVVIAFDNDEPGREAAEACAKLLPPGKARIATWPLKDANDSLVAGDFEGIRSTLFNAKEVKPDGVMSVADIPPEDFESLYTRGTTLPFPILNNKLKGLQSGAVYTFVAQEKAGKSLLTKEIVLHLLEQGKKVGLLYLEEGAPEAARSLIAMLDNVPAWKLREDKELLNGPEGIKKRLERFRDNCIVYHHNGVISMDNVYAAMEYMATALKCDFLVLDNTSLAIAGTDVNKNERKLIENFVFKMVALANNTKTTILNVCHLTKNRKDGMGKEDHVVTRSDVFGSGAFCKYSYSLIALERNFDTGTTFLKILADRGPGGTGYADKLGFDPSTGRLFSINDTEVLE